MDGKYSNYMAHEKSSDKMPHDDHNHNNLDVEHSHDHGHSHNIRDKNSKILAFCLSVTFSFAMVEFIGGYFTHSISLQSDAVHMLTDAAGLLIAFLASRISQRPATINLTFGYGKAEAIGALINCIFTMVLTCGLLIEVIQRFFDPVEVHGMGLFIIAGIGFIVNGFIAYLLSADSHSLNTRAALIHTLGDLLASAIAIVAGVIIYFTGISIVDPILSLIVIIILITSNYSLIKKSMLVLMAGVPEHLNYEKIGLDLEAIKGVIGIHDLHIWYMSTNQVALSAHILTTEPFTWQETLLLCQKMLLEKHQIGHITLQHEFDHNSDTSTCGTNTA